MSVEKVGRSLAALTVLALVATGCTPDPAPTPTPTPSVSQTPTESAQERQQRIDYEAAEKAYRTFRAEYNRVLRAGGAKEPTPLMKKTAGNGYLTEVQEVAEAYKGLGYRRTGEEKIVFVKRVGYTPTAIALSVCEDTRQVVTKDKNGRKVGTGEVRLLELEVRGDNGTWRLWSGSGKESGSCD